MKRFPNAQVGHHKYLLKTSSNIGLLDEHLYLEKVLFGLLYMSIVKVYQFVCVLLSVWFDGVMWGLIVLVHVHCLSFYLEHWIFWLVVLGLTAL